MSTPDEPSYNLVTEQTCVDLAFFPQQEVNTRTLTHGWKPATENVIWDRVIKKSEPETLRLLNEEDRSIVEPKKVEKRPRKKRPKEMEIVGGKDENTWLIKQREMSLERGLGEDLRGQENRG